MKLRILIILILSIFIVTFLTPSCRLYSEKKTEDEPKYTAEELEGIQEEEEIITSVTRNVSATGGEEQLEEIEESLRTKVEKILRQEPKDVVTKEVVTIEDYLKAAIELAAEVQKLPEGDDIAEELMDWSNKVLESLADNAISDYKTSPGKESYKKLMKILELQQQFGSDELVQRLENTSYGHGYVVKLKETIYWSFEDIKTKTILLVGAYTCGNNQYNEWSGTVKVIHSVYLPQGEILESQWEVTFIIPEGGGDFTFELPVIPEGGGDYPFGPNPQLRDSFMLGSEEIFSKNTLTFKGRLSENTLTISILKYGTDTPAIVISGPIEEVFIFIDTQGSSIIDFGDGLEGRKATSEDCRIKIYYREGAGGKGSEEK